MVATWSLRERPACSRSPAVPACSRTRASIAPCTSSNVPPTRPGLEGAGGDLRGHAVERGAQRARVVRAQHAAGFERRDVRARAAHVELRQHEVVVERGAEGQQRRVGRGREAPAPLQPAALGGSAVLRQVRYAGWGVARCAASFALAAPAATGSPWISMNPPAASWRKRSPAP